MNHWAEAKRLSYVLDGDNFSAVLLQLGYSSAQSVTPEQFRIHYRQQVCDVDGWPKCFPVLDAKTIEEGLIVRSLSTEIEGRTTGSRLKCKADGCSGWFVGVLWETGQQMYICSEGWHFDAETKQVQVIAGGEISARFISPKPLGVLPLPREDWPSYKHLIRRKGWRVNPK